MRGRILTGFLLIALAISACNQIPSTMDEQAALGTAVAATLAAGSAGADSTETTNPDVTDKVMPTPTPGPTTLPETTLESFLLVYTSDGNLWTLSPDGSSQQLTTTGDVVEMLISDDRQVIVYVRQAFQPEVFELRAINTDGSGDRQLLSQETLDALYPLNGALHYLTSQLEFIPGTHTLLFNTRATFEGPGLAKNDDLHQLNVDTGERTQLLERGRGGDFTISPDRQRLAISQADSIGVVNIDGTNLRPDLVTFQPIVTYSEYQWYPVVVWADDASRFGVFLPSADPLAENPNGTVWIVPVSGTPQSFSPIQGQAFFPQSNRNSLLSPDLQTVAFLREDSQNQTQVLLLANVDGSNSRTYDQGDLQWIGWGPDAAHFAYIRDQNSLTLGTPGGSPQPLTEGRSLRWLTGSLYTVQSGQHGDWTLIMGQINGPTKELVRLTSDWLTYDVR
ncbi:MAG: hypothetical protein P1P76_11615 [Anaerolineales bacterium]|nr:hypothetical protein [Anaerolineales bacterium]